MLCVLGTCRSPKSNMLSPVLLVILAGARRGMATHVDLEDATRLFHSWFQGASTPQREALLLQLRGGQVSTALPNQPWTPRLSQRLSPSSSIR